MNNKNQTVASNSILRLIKNEKYQIDISNLIFKMLNRNKINVVELANFLDNIILIENIFSRTTEEEVRKAIEAYFYEETEHISISFRHLNLKVKVSDHHISLFSTKSGSMNDSHLLTLETSNLNKNEINDLVNLIKASRGTSEKIMSKL